MESTTPSPFLLLMPSYNQAQFVGAAIRSIIAQDDPDWELWILDNSSDSTPDVVRTFQDPRIKFHHIPRRMDPGTCLNWMLERAQGDLFSYVHTDNNLHASYVRRMRQALSQHPLSLAYCDTWTLNEHGHRTAVSRRGSFDLARLFSLDALGVPFAATMELARRLGGFSSDDPADDVRFCAGAWGLAQYTYVREPLVDYRVHEKSRTTSSGGTDGVRRLILNVILRLAPEMARKGTDVPIALAHAGGNALQDLELFVEDLWYRKLGKVASAWWPGEFDTRYLYGAGLLSGVPGGMRGPWGGNPGPWSRTLMRVYLKTRQRDFKRLTEKITFVLVPWALLALGTREPKVQLADLSFRTVFAASLLQRELGWTFVAPSALGPCPAWLNCESTKGNEPVFSARDVPTLG